MAALIGPRQSGKTTLARQFVAPDSPNYFDLEDLTSLVRLQEPMTALRGLRGVVVIDEIQRRPDLFPLLRVLADREANHSVINNQLGAPGDANTRELLAFVAERVK